MFKGGIQMKASERKYVSWIRVSTKGQGQSGLGLAAQETIIRHFLGGEPVETFTDVWSGTNLKGAPNLRRAIELCKREGYLLVIAKTDRFRNAEQALAVLNEVGEENIHFCDLPSTNRMILTVMFAVYENQAIMGRINTKRALDERKKQAKRDGGWISKSGRFCKKLGNSKGCDTSPASEAAAIAHRERKENDEKWKEAKRIATKLYNDGKNSVEISEELNFHNHKTRRGNHWSPEAVRRLLKT